MSLCAALPLLRALCMVNMLMVMICNICVLPSRDGPCWSSTLNSCRTRLATLGKDSMLYRKDTDKQMRHCFLTLHLAFFLDSHSVLAVKNNFILDITHPTLVKSFPCACRKLRMNLLFSCTKARRPERKVLQIFRQHFYLART